MTGSLTYLPTDALTRTPHFNTKSHIHAALAHRAHHDSLTGLINRDKLQEHISEILMLRQSARGA